MLFSRNAFGNSKRAIGVKCQGAEMIRESGPPPTRRSREKMQGGSGPSRSSDQRQGIPELALCPARPTC